MRDSTTPVPDAVANIPKSPVGSVFASAMK